MHSLPTHSHSPFITLGDNFLLAVQIFWGFHPWHLCLAPCTYHKMVWFWIERSHTNQRVVKERGSQDRGFISTCTYMSRSYIDCVNKVKSHWGTSEKRGLNNLQIVHNVSLIILEGAVNVHFMKNRCNPEKRGGWGGFPSCLKVR